MEKNFDLFNIYAKLFLLGLILTKLIVGFVYLSDATVRPIVRPVDAVRDQDLIVQTDIVAIGTTDAIVIGLVVVLLPLRDHPAITGVQNSPVLQLTSSVRCLLILLKRSQEVIESLLLLWKLFRNLKPAQMVPLVLKVH